MAAVVAGLLVCAFVFVIRVSLGGTEGEGEAEGPGSEAEAYDQDR